MAERHLLFWDWAVRNYLPYVSPTGPCVDVIKTNDLKTQLPSLRLLKCLSCTVQHRLSMRHRRHRRRLRSVPFTRSPTSPTIPLPSPRFLSRARILFFWPPRGSCESAGRCWPRGFHFVNWHRRTFRPFVFALMFSLCFEGERCLRSVARFHYERYTRAATQSRWRTVLSIRNYYKNRSASTL